MRKLLGIGAAVSILALAAPPAHALQVQTPYAFSSSSYSVNEGDATGAVITVTRTGSLASTPKISCAFAPGSNVTAPPSLDADYTRTSAPLKFAANGNSATCTLPIVNDTTYEGPESVTITLVGPTTAALTPASTLTIVDDDPFIIVT